MQRSEAADWLGEVDTARQKTRSARGGVWFPLLVFGLLSLAASPLYTEGQFGGIRTSSLWGLSWFAGGEWLRDPGLVSLFWVLALPLGYAATVMFFRRRARRSGVASPLWPYVVAGLGFLLFLVAFSWFGRQQPGDLFTRGLTPLLTVALGLLVLAWVARSIPLAIFGVAFLGLALEVSLSDFVSVLNAVRITIPDGAVPASNVIVPGVVLILGGAGFWIAERRRR